MGIVSVILTIILVVVTLALIGLILIQRGKGGGLAGAFGGSGVEQAFGTRATTLAQKATAVLGAIYLVLSVVLGVLLAPHPAPQAGAGSSEPSHETAPPPPAPTEAE